METTQTPTPGTQTPPVSSILAELKQTVNGNDLKPSPQAAPVIEQKAPAMSGMSDADFLNTNRHTKDPVFSLPNQPGQPNVPGGTSKPLTQVIANSGKFAVTLIHEMAIPALAVFGLKLFRKVTNREGWKPTKEDKEILVPAWESYLASVNVNFDKPIYQLLIAIAFCYGSKFMEGVIEIKDTPKGSIADQITNAPEKVTKDNFENALQVERENLILLTNKKRKVSRKANIKWLQETGAFERLEKAFREKHKVTA